MADMALKIKDIIPGPILKLISSGGAGTIIDAALATIVHHFIKRNKPSSWAELSWKVIVEMLLCLLLHLGLWSVGLSPTYISMIQWGSTLLWKYVLEKPVKKLATHAWNWAKSWFS
jgi:hypothetical protein